MCVRVCVDYKWPTGGGFGGAHYGRGTRHREPAACVSDHT